jgi:hypothetical protein
MKFTITLHPVSLAVGAAALGGVLWLVSAVQAPASTGAATARAVSQIPLTISNPIEVKGVPVPGNAVRIVEGTPYVVPAGRILVLTALGRAEVTLGLCTLQFDGQTVATAEPNSSTAAGAKCSMVELPPGLVAASGSTVTVQYQFSPSNPGAQAWGYLTAP